jgi:hypothetical protein
MCTICFNIRKLCILPTQCSDYFPVGGCYGDELFPVRWEMNVHIHKCVASNGETIQRVE